MKKKLIIILIILSILLPFTLYYKKNEELQYEVIITVSTCAFISIAIAQGVVSIVDHCTRFIPTKKILF